MLPSQRRGVAVLVKGRVRVRVTVGVPRVTLVGVKSVPVIGTVANVSRVGVGVAVGGSRVGMGACVGVASKVPGGNGMIVGGGRVGVTPKIGGVIGVGVGARGTKLERTKMLTVPAQYITSEPMTAMAKQPYPSC
jgi:hypothetical protein